MPFTVNMPKLSPTMEEGTIVKWHAAENSFVEAGSLLVEVATDKATIEYNALDSGWLRKILISENKTARVNQPIAIFTEEKTESIEGYQPPSILPKEEPKQVVEATPMSKKEVQESVSIGLKPKFTPEKPLENYSFEMPSGAIEKRISASPLAKKLAKEKGLDLSTVKGTGPGARIVSEDLKYAQPAGAVVFGKREAPQLAPGTYEEEALTPMRKAIGQRLQESKTFIPHFYVEMTINAAELVAVREQLSTFEIKPTINDFILRATSLALKTHPEINCGYNSVAETIIHFKTIDIAVAVNLESGLITPIIRHADYKNLGEISVEMRSLAARAKEGKLAPEEYRGGSFTLSNLGMFGVSSFQAIINPPQAAILAVSGIQEVPVVKNGSVVAGKTMHLCLSADHRVIDGAKAATFLKTLKKYLENPVVLLI